MKPITFVLFLIILIAIAACTGGTETPNLAQPFIGGDKAIVLYLQEGLPPNVIYDKSKSTFGIGVAMENVGEANVGTGTDNPNVFIRLEGINPSQFGLEKGATMKTFKQLNERIDGARKNFDGTIFPGQLTNVIFEPLTYAPDLKGNTQITIRADVCYDYTTYTSTPICIKDNALESLADATICTLTGEKFPRNSGGPVHVGSLIENPLGDDKYQISFTLEHVGVGEFFHRTELPAGMTATASSSSKTDGTYPCDHSVTNPDKYDVYVKVGDIEGMTINCPRIGGSQGYVKLYNGAPTVVTCTLIKTDGNVGTRAYQEILSVDLYYMYSEFIETPILIQDVTN
ncbi:MAG: hypothetical protein ABIA93_04665 [Candidatus Woesearchaeota archaeon]